MPPRRSLWVITVCALLSAHCCAQFTPLVASSESECALLLEGPGRTSAFDYNLNALRGTFGYGGQHTCITYDAVNQAYIQARKRINVAQPKTPIWKTEEIATVGELLLDISINLAKTYGLSYEDIEKGLPLIDTSKTLIREVCPPFLANVECRPGKYRRYDGLCSNLQHPTWGATMTPFTRLVGPLYADGMTAPRISVMGTQLPLPRIVSRTVHPDEGFHDHAGTVMVVAWGQFMDHDYTLTATPLDPLNRNEPEECCNRPAHLKNPYCLEIHIPADDYFYSLFGLRCQDFVRGFPAVRPGCRLGSRAPFNTLTGVLDGNTVYGVSEKFARHLRAGYGGLLRMNPVFTEFGLKDLLPLKLDIPDEGCTRPNRSMYCFEGGEIRVNEQLVLTCMHTLMAREHNRVAHALSQINPHWDDETLYQEARRIVIAEIQHITYNEFLPIILGKEVMEKFGLLTQKEGYWDGYDPNVNPNVIDAFAAAAFRFGHSLLPTAIERWSKAHKFIASRRLSDLIRQPYDLYRAGVLDEYFMGLMNQVAQAMDDSVTQEVTNHLFKKPGARFGMDLASFNMQRGREFGLPGYMEFRKFCGLPDAHSFDELFGSMSNETIRRYASIYEHPSDVDLWSGGVSERPLPGSMVGPTFACIIATQFSYSRRGDRFWYELGNQPSSFTPEQLQEIRKAKLSRVICDNTDLIDTIQVYPMVLPDHEINPRVPCRSGVIPGIDLTKWADFAAPAAVPGATPFKQPEKTLQAYPTQTQPEQQTQTLNTNQDHGPQLAANPDIVQSIETHSFDDPMIAAPSQQTVGDNRLDETVTHDDTIPSNGTDNTLTSNGESDVNRLKRDTSKHEVINQLTIHKHGPRNKLQQMKAYKLSKLSNGYKTKINPSFPPLETWPIGTTRVRRGVAAHVSIYGEPAGNYPEEIQSHDDGEQTDLPKIRGHHKRRERTVMKLLPVDRKDTQTYQVHELSDEEPNQESHVQSKPSISPVHKTTTSQNRHSQHVGPATADEERPSPGKESSGLWPEHNGNAEDAITVFGHTPALVQAEQNYRELERNGDGMRSRSDVDTDLSHGQGQETSRHDPRTGSDIHGQRLNHHLEQSNGNKEEPIQANTQSDLESETNASRRPNEQMGGRREPVTDYYEYENTGPSLTYDEEDGPEHRKHTTASDGWKEMPFRSMSLSDIPSSSPRSDPSLAGTPDSAELHVEAKAGNEGRRSNKDESAGYDEEPVMNREQNDDGSESYEPFQLKYVTLGHNSQNTEYPIYETENEDSMETRGETEEEVKKEEKEEKEKEKEKKEKEKREKEKREKEEAEEAEGGIYAALSKILEKKDAISRDEDIVGREEGENTNKKQADSYHNYWVLEYSRPKFSK